VKKTAPSVPAETRASRKIFTGLFFSGNMKIALMDIMSSTIEAKNQLVGVMPKLKFSLSVIPITSYETLLLPVKKT